MQRISEQDVLKTAKAIDSACGEPKMFSKPLIIRIRGDMAAFSRPEFRVEKHTYDVPTFAAMRNLLQSVFWHRGFNYIPVFCGIEKPIQKEVLSTSGIKKMADRNGKKPIVVTHDVRMQMSTEYLTDVSYVVVAYITSRPNEMNPGDNLKKFYEMASRRIAKGQYGRTPVLGTKECYAETELLDEEALKAASFISKTSELGLMWFDFDYSDKNSPNRLFKPLTLNNGTVNYMQGEVVRIHA